jgi:energy-coupling factor transporter ATP-binding protein EcfA2
MTVLSDNARILQFEAENVQGLKVVKLSPDRNSVVVSGPNGCGKSSVLDSLEMAMLGAKHFSKRPIRDGETHAHVKIDIGDLATELQVERTFTPNGSYLTVKTADGRPVKSPQDILNSLFSGIAFDPLEFMSLKPERQVEELKHVAGLDFKDLDVARDKAYGDRTLINRQVTQAEWELKQIDPAFEDAPVEEVKAGELVAELTTRQDVNAANAEQRTALHDLELAEQEAADLVATVVEEVAELRRRLEESENRLAVARADLKDSCDKAKAQLAIVEALEDADAEEIKHDLAEVDDQNRKYRHNERRRLQESRIADLKEQSLALTAQLDGIEAERLARIAAAPLPLPGLGFGDDGVTFDGIPLEQVNTASIIEISVEMGLAMHPKLRVLLIRRGNDLDDETFPVIARLAAKHDAQFWIERIRPDGQAAIVIREGEVAEVVAAVEGDENPY